MVAVSTLAYSIAVTLPMSDTVADIYGVLVDLTLNHMCTELGLAAMRAY